MKSDKKPVIGFICVMLSCILVIGITFGLLISADKNEVASGSTTDTTNNTEEPPAEEPNSEPELQWNYKFKYFAGAIDGGWIGEIAYKSQKNTFNIDEVTLTVSYGSFSSGYGTGSCDVPEFDFYFADPSGDIDESIYTIKTVKEQFFSEKYAINYVDDSLNRVYYYEYNHTEEITIPKELFTESEGVIRMVIAGVNVAEHSQWYHGYLTLGKADIKYQVKGNEVVLSKPYEDDNDWHY